MSNNGKLGVYLIPLSESELDTVLNAAETLRGLQRLAWSLGLEPEALTAQCEVLSSFKQRTHRSVTPTYLRVERPEETLNRQREVAVERFGALVESPEPSRA